MVSVGKWELDDLVDVKKLRESRCLKELNKAKENFLREETILIRYKNISKEAKDKLNNQINVAKQEKQIGTTSDKVQGNVHYIESLEEILKKRQESVASQAKKVDAASSVVEQKKHAYSEAAKEVNKLKEFKKDWVIQETARILSEEEEEIDEVGNLLFENRRRSQDVI